MPEFGRYNRIVPHQLIQLMGDDLRLHRTVGPRAALLQHLAPSLHALLRLFEEAAVLVHRELRQKSVKDSGRVPNQRALDRGAQADAFRIMVDLYDPRLTRLGIELDIGK